MMRLYIPRKYLFAFTVYLADIIAERDRAPFATAVYAAETDKPYIVLDNKNYNLAKSLLNKFIKEKQNHVIEVGE